MSIEHKDIQIQAMAQNLLVMHGIDGVRRLMAALVTSATYEVMTAKDPGTEMERQHVLDVVTELYSAWQKIDFEMRDIE